MASAAGGPLSPFLGEQVYKEQMYPPEECKITDGEVQVAHEVNGGKVPTPTTQEDQLRQSENRLVP